jgi:hypothetical protein
MQVASFWQGVFWHVPMSDSQREPVQPGGHSQWNSPTSSLQVAPFRQGSEAQSSMFTYGDICHNIESQSLTCNHEIFLIYSCGISPNSKPLSYKMIQGCFLISYPKISTLYAYIFVTKIKKQINNLRQFISHCSFLTI